MACNVKRETGVVVWWPAPRVGVTVAPGAAAGVLTRRHCPAAPALGRVVAAVFAVVRRGHRPAGGSDGGQGRRGSSQLRLSRCFGGLVPGIGGSLRENLLVCRNGIT